MGKWLIFLWGVVVPFGMAVDGEVRPESWTDGLVMAFGFLVILGIVMLFAPRFTGMWAMGFAAGSALALIISPIKGYPMLDIGFGVQALGGWGLAALSAVVWERKKERDWLKDPKNRKLRASFDEIGREIERGALIAAGEAHSMMVNSSGMAGRGVARLEPDGGPLKFILTPSGRCHTIDRRFIKNVDLVEDEETPAGTLMIQFTPTVSLLGISITPTDGDREKWLALAPKEESSS
ncbi:hypothetical protein ABZX85_11585 [Streptomyces sp. NPDC004539]|uniref:hypothetical protein n=1 Tax=Streptomyces sp. NPDC004539 TaxID=3154280 RepID=UPI0033AEEFCC